MANDSFFNFFIDVRPRVSDKDIDAVVRTMEDRIKKIETKINESEGKNLQTTEKKYSNFFTSLEKKTIAFTAKLSAFTSVIGALSTLKFNSIKEFSEDLKGMRGNAEEVFNFLNASNKVAGVSQQVVQQDIASLFQSKRTQQATGQNDRGALALIGASLQDDVDVILSKYKKTMERLNYEQRRVLTERLGFSQDTLRVAQLTEQQIKQLAAAGFYNKENIKKLEQTAQATKELMGGLADVKDRMILSFSPLVISLLSSIRSALESKSVEKIAGGFVALGEDIALFNKTLGGIPFKALLGVMLLEYALRHKMLFAIGAIASVVQDVYHGIKEAFGFKTVKKSVTADILRSRPLQTAGSVLVDDEDNDVTRALETIKKYDIQKPGEIKNNITNNQQRAHNTIINVNVKGNADRQTANDIARQVKKTIEYNENRQLTLNDKR